MVAQIGGYQAAVVAAVYAGFAGGLLGLMQGFMPPDAFMFDTSGQLVMQTAIGGAGTLFGPLLGAAVSGLLYRAFAREPVEDDLFGEEEDEVVLVP